MSDNLKYHIALKFTKDTEDCIKSGVWTGDIARRMIFCEIGLDPSTDNGDGDIRYDTDNAEKFAYLMVVAHRHSDGGWFCVEPMPKGITVYHFSMFGGHK